jgi:hypothetical protein
LKRGDATALKNLFKPVYFRDLPILQCRMILESHLFIKQKRLEKINTQKVARGNKMLLKSPRIELQLGLEELVDVLITITPDVSSTSPKTR